MCLFHVFAQLNRYCPRSIQHCAQGQNQNAPAVVGYLTPRCFAKRGCKLLKTKSCEPRKERQGDSKRAVKLDEGQGLSRRPTVDKGA